MDLLQKSFNKILHEKINSRTILRKAVNKKFESLGVKLEEDKITEILDALELNKSANLQIDIDDERLISSKITAEEKLNKKLDITLDKADVNDVLNEVLSAIPEIYNSLVDTSADEILGTFRQKMSSVLKENEKEKIKFEKHLKELWNKPIELLEYFIFLVIDIVATFNKHYGETAIKQNDLVFEVLLGLYVRSCQVATEVLVLLKAGFADGAHARWRTLHEIAVVALFIDKYGDETAERYLLHECVEDYKGAVQHQNYCEVTNNIPLTDEEFKEIENNYNDVISQFGADFRSEYGWASKALNIKRPTFSDIERDVKLDTWRPDYKLASHNVHANPMGLSVKLGRLPKDSHRLLIGASAVGLSEPGQNTAMSLLKVVTTLLFRKTNIDVLIFCKILMKLEKEISSEFVKVQKEIEQHFV